jgi:hypothetical protein
MRNNLQAPFRYQIRDGLVRSSGDFNPFGLRDSLDLATCTRQIDWIYSIYKI